MMNAKGAAVVGLNCHWGPNTIIIAPMQAIAKECHFPLACLPVGYNCNHECPTMQELSQKGMTYTDLDGHVATRYDFAQFAKECQRLNIQYIGTCCGCAPHHLRAMAMAIGRAPEAA
eukprot:6506660-Pyramimonas_sp.AAC.1